MKRYSHITFFYSSFCPALSWRRVFQYYPTFVSSCRVYFSTEARSCGVFYPPPVQADMLSACLEYEDILSDKRRGAHQFRRICYPPVWSMRIYYPTNKEEPTPALPKGGGQGASTYTFRRICYPPEQKEPGIRGAPSPLPWGGAGGWASTPLFLGGCTAAYCGLKILIFSSGG